MNFSLPELLAPAGTPDAAWAALTYGADAVYAGLPRFSARAEAENFSPEALDELIGYAHYLGRRVYFAFNTLVQQREMNDALETLALIRDLNADGVIVQDMGMARLVRKKFPTLRLHASTQLAVHNTDGAQQLASLGFKRVVLARELSLEEIAQISRTCGIETEVFIHGALCYSYSGLCLFSSHLLGRSGNRGRCASCCRQPFRSGLGNEAFSFSMKDFCAANHLEAIRSSRVTALKIEGRMKSPLYVAAVTDFYRRALAGEADDMEQRLSDIQTIFGRPSTDLYLGESKSSPIDPVNDGHRGALIGTVKERVGPWLILHSNRALQKHDGLKVETSFGFAADEMRLASDPESKRRFELPADAEIALKLPPDAPRIEKGAPVYCSYSQAVRQRYEFTAPRPGQFRQRRPVDLRVVQSAGAVKLTASADGVQSELVLSGPFEPARQPEKGAAAIRQCFEKLGDTDWRLGELTLEGAAVFIPVSTLNDARRRLIGDFSEQWRQLRCGTEFFFEPWEKTGGAGFFWSVKSRVFQPFETIDEFVLEIDPARSEEVEKAQAFYADRLRLALPVILRDKDAEAYQRWISQRKNERDARSTFPKWEAANVGGLHLLRGMQDITADWPLYTLNTQAALEWKDQGVQRFVLSPEDDAQNLYALIEELGDAAVIPVYQHTPLMISATNPAADEGRLTDRSRRNFRVEQNGWQFVLVNETPFSLADHLDELKTKGACSFRMDLSYGIYAPDEASDLVRCMITGQPVPGHSGNFLRGLQ